MINFSEIVRSIPTIKAFEIFIYYETSFKILVLNTLVCITVDKLFSHQLKLCVKFKVQC